MNSRFVSRRYQVSCLKRMHSSSLVTITFPIPYHTRMVINILVLYLNLEDRNLGRNGSELSRITQSTKVLRHKNTQ